jgi:transcriptional regulator with XRE-family HTH domain
MNIQQAIKAKCKEKNIPMKTIAEGLGISMVALWRSLSGKQDIGIDRLKIICDILNCEMTLMIGTDKEVLVLIDK